MKTELERVKEALRYALTETCRMHKAFGERVAADVERILDPPTAYEDVEVVNWVCQSCDFVIRVEPSEKDEGCCNNTNFVKLTGTYKRPVPQPVERSVSGTVRWKDANGGYIYPQSIGARLDWEDIAGKTGTLTFTWTEP